MLCYVKLRYVLYVCMWLCGSISRDNICMGMNTRLPYIDRRGTPSNLTKPLVAGSTLTSSTVCVNVSHPAPLFLSVFWVSGV